MSATDVTVHFHAGHNMPGYLPESEPATFATFEDAKSDMLWTLNLHADNVQSWTDEHDCDDVPCPTYGDDCGYDQSNSLSLAAEDLNLDNGPEWSDVVAGQSYWIVQCSEPECAPDDDDVQCGACPASSCVHHTCPNCGRWTEFDPCPYCPKTQTVASVTILHHDNPAHAVAVATGKAIADAADLQPGDALLSRWAPGRYMTVTAPARYFYGYLAVDYQTEDGKCGTLSVRADVNPVAVRPTFPSIATTQASR